MISALHLIWIIPCCTAFGFLLAAVLGSNGDDECPIRLQLSDHDRLYNLSKRLGVTETEVFQGALKFYEDGLDAVAASRNQQASISLEIISNKE